MPRLFQIHLNKKSIFAMKSGLIAKLPSDASTDGRHPQSLDYYLRADPRCLQLSNMGEVFSDASLSWQPSTITQRCLSR